MFGGTVMVEAIVHNYYWNVSNLCANVTVKWKMEFSFILVSVFGRGAFVVGDNYTNRKLKKYCNDTKYVFCVT